MTAGVLERPNVRPGDDGKIVLPDGTVWQIPPHPLSGRIQPASQLIPRTCVIPSYAFSSGPEAIEVAASAGLILDPWEQLALILGLGETRAGKWAAFMVALIVARQNGKGSALEALELYWLFATGERLIGHTAHEYKTAMEAFRRLLFLIENTDWMRKKVKKIINTNGEEGIELLHPSGSRTMTGQRLRFLARSKGAGRGFSFPKLIWDEAYALNQEQQEAQLPTLSAMINPQIWVTSSPPLTSDTGVPLFNLRRDIKAEGEVALMDYGLPGVHLDDLGGVNLDDEELWISTNPNAPERISVEAMRRERSAMGDRGFARERLCIWPPDLTKGYKVITKEEWAAMEDRHSGKSNEALLRSMGLDSLQVAQMMLSGAGETMGQSLVGRPCVCPDISPRTGGTVLASIGLAQKRKDGKTHIELVKKGSGSSWLIPDLVKLVVSADAVIVIDPGAPAGSILADLQQALKDHFKNQNLDTTKYIISMASRDVAQAFGMIYDAAKAPGDQPRSIVHLPQEELALAIAGADDRKIGSDGNGWDRISASVDITCLIAVTNAAWGVVKAPPPPNSEAMVAWA